MPDAMRRWANDELRSPDAQIEYVLCEALREAGRLEAAGGAARKDQNARPRCTRVIK